MSRVRILTFVVIIYFVSTLFYGANLNKNNDNSQNTGQLNKLKFKTNFTDVLSGSTLYFCKCDTINALHNETKVETGSSFSPFIGDTLGEILLKI